MKRHRMPCTASASPSASGNRPFRRSAMLAALIVLSVRAAQAASFSVPDAVFWGTVAVDGSPAPAGTIVSGRVGDELASHVLGSDAENPELYSLRIPLSRPESVSDPALPGTALVGDSVQLLVNGELVVELVLEPGTLTRADLNETGSPPATFTGTPVRATPTVTATRPTRTNTVRPTPTRTGTGRTPTATGLIATPTANPLTPSRTPTDTPTATPTPEIACVGDCDGSGDVTVAEAIVLVNVALGNRELDACLAGDRDGDGMITVDELIFAASRVQNGCGD